MDYLYLQVVKITEVSGQSCKRSENDCESTGQKDVETVVKQNKSLLKCTFTDSYTQHQDCSEKT